MTTAAGKRTGLPARAWEGTQEDLKQAAKKDGFSMGTIVPMLADVLAGDYLRCRRGHPVPLILGDLSGRTMREWVIEAEKAVRYQNHEDHQPVYLGVTAGKPAEPPAPRHVIPRAGEAVTAPRPPARRVPRQREAPPAAPDEPAATARQLAATVPGVTTASELPGPTAVFRAGPDVDCLHENIRGVKGICPDCKQWVGGKR